MTIRIEFNAVTKYGNPLTSAVLRFVILNYKNAAKLTKKVAKLTKKVAKLNTCEVILQESYGNTFNPQVNKQINK